MSAPAVLLTGRAADRQAAVAIARGLANEGARVSTWLTLDGEDPDTDGLLAVARANADREVPVPAEAPNEPVSRREAPRVDGLARVLMIRMLGVQAGQAVLIEGPDLTAPLLVRCADLARSLGARASVRVGVDGLERTLLESSTIEALGEPDTIASAVLDAAQGTLRVQAEYRPHALEGVPADRLAARVHALAPLRAARMQRSADGTLRWALTAWPCRAYATEAGMSPTDFADLLFAAAKVDGPGDPIAVWEAVAAAQERLRERLESGSELRVVAPGTDVVLGIGGRTWRSSAANRNLPDGEVFTGPIEDSAEGSVHFDVPAARQGRRVAGVRMRFAAGAVVEATAEEGEDLLHAALDADAGARRLGEVGIGTNFGLTRATGQILLDEKIGGTFHLAVGAGYPETGSTNVSAEHWDFIGDLRRGGEILLDGVPIQRDGRFLDGLMDGL